MRFRPINHNRFSLFFVFVITAVYSLVRPEVGLRILNDVQRGRDIRLSNKADKLHKGANNNG